MTPDKTPANDGDPRETPLDDPRNADGESSSSQTDKPWKGNPEKEQFPKDRADLDLEKWNETKTH